MSEKLVGAFRDVISQFGILFQRTKFFIIDVFSVQLIDKFKEISAPPEEITEPFFPERVARKRRERLNTLIEEPDRVSILNINEIGILLSCDEVDKLFHGKKLW